MAKPTTPEKTDDKDEIKKDENENIRDKAEEKQEKGTPFIKQSSFPSVSLDVFAQAQKNYVCFLGGLMLHIKLFIAFPIIYLKNRPHITNSQFNWDGICLVYSLVGWLVSGV